MNVIIKRPITYDLQWLYELAKERNSPDINIDFIMPDFESHVDWFYSHISELHIIEFEGKPIGYIQIKPENEIGIFIFKEFCHRGIGTYALNLFMEESKFIAKINPNNKPSQKLFEKVGFKPTYILYSNI